MVIPKKNSLIIILIIGLGLQSQLWCRSYKPKLMKNSVGVNKIININIALENKQAQKRKKGGHSQKNNLEQLLFLRSEWVDEWEPGLPERASQLIITKYGSAQWAVYSRKEIMHVYVGHLSCDSLLSKAIEVDFFNLRKQYVTKVKPSEPLPEGHPSQVNVVIKSSARSHEIISEQKLMPSSLRDFTNYLKERAEEVREAGCPAPKGAYLRITPVSENSIQEIKKLGIYRIVEEKEILLSSALQEALSATFYFVRLDQKEKHITEILGKKKGKYFYPFFKIGSTLYEASIYLYNGEGAGY